MYAHGFHTVNTVVLAMVINIIICKMEVGVLALLHGQISGETQTDRGARPT